MIALLALFACVEDLSEGRTAAVVEDPTPAAEAKVKADPEPAAEGTAWTVDTSKSKIQALGAKITAKHPIVFHEYTGQVKVADGKVTGVDFTVQIASLESDHPKLTGHLKTPDFFDVETHPTATFTSSSVTEGAEAEGMTHTVKGEFTIRGETKVVTFPAKIEVAGDSVTASTEFTLDRQDFKVTYPGRPDDLVQDTVVMTIELSAAKPSA